MANPVINQDQHAKCMEYLDKCIGTLEMRQTEGLCEEDAQILELISGTRAILAKITASDDVDESGLDFVAVLPEQLALQVFGYLNDRTREKCSLVCRKWDEFFKKDLYSRKPTEKAFEDRSNLLTYLKRREEWTGKTDCDEPLLIQELELRRKRHVSNLLMLSSLGAGCIVTRRLTISPIRCDELKGFIRHESGVRRMAQNLHYLEVDFNEEVDLRHLREMLMYMTELKELRIGVFKTFKLPDSSSKRPLTLSKLKTLSIGTARNGQLEPGEKDLEPFSQGVTQFVCQLNTPNLADFRLLSTGITVEGLRHLAMGTSHLKAVRITQSSYVPFYILEEAFLGTSVRLETLEYYNRSHTTNRLPKQVFHKGHSEKQDFAFLSRLANLRLERCKLGRDSLMTLIRATDAHLRTFSLQTHFRHMEVYDVNFFEEFLHEMPMLEELKLNPLHQQGCRKLAEALTVETLSHPLLRLDVGLDKAADAHYLMSSCSHKKFQELYIRSPDASRRVVRSLAGTDPMCSVFRTKCSRKSL